MRIIIISILLVISHSISAVTWEWAIGSGSNGMDRIWDIANDPTGNIIITGEFNDTLTVNDTTNPTEITGWGLNDISLIKYSSQGELLWARAFGGTDGDVGISVGSDNAGNVYVTGYYSGTAHFGDISLTSSGSWDIFVVKINAIGDVLWAVSEGGASNDIGYGLAVTDSGICYVTGWFGGTITFHDGTSLTSYGSSDILALAYDSSGNLLWKRQAGTSEVEYGYRIDADYAGNCYVTGSAGMNSNFDGLYTPGDGAFIASYTPSGEIRWVNSAIGGGAYDIGVNRLMNPNPPRGSITARLSNTAVLGDYTVSNTFGASDAYYGEFDLNTGQWTATANGGGAGSDLGRSVVWQSHAYYTGSFEQSADIFGFNVISNGLSDGFIYSKGIGNDDWVMTYGGINNDVPTGITVASDGSVYISGWFSGFARFGSSIVINSGSDSDLDFFIAKINPYTATQDETETETQAPFSLRVLQNPFYQSACLELQTEKSQSVSIHVYNTKGQLVTSYLPAHYTPGIHRIYWDGNDMQGIPVSPGIYYFQSVSENRRCIRKALLMR